MTFRRIAGFLCLNFFVASLSYAGAVRPPAACIDSIDITVKPVRCFGLRDGEITVDTVFGGVRPFYYSIDGYTFSTFPVFDRLWAGTYTLWIRDAMSCEQMQTVVVSEPELLEISLTASDTSIKTGTEIRLSAEYTPADAEIRKISWRPPGLFPVQDTLVQYARLQESTTIAVEIVSNSGCHASTQLEIEVGKINFYSPNIIKQGSNQDAWFTIFAEEGMTSIENLQIFGRNGTQVFERRNFPPNEPLSGWNGKFQDKYVSPGVYSWTALLVFADGHREKHAGSITVVR